MLDLPVAIIWLIWGVYWFASAFYDQLSGKAKRAERTQPFVSGRSQGIFLVIALILSISILPQSNPLGTPILSGSLPIFYVGVIVAGLGVAFSIWARRYLGGNWSSTVQLKKNHQLVQGGPYAIVRHPIYSGISLGIVGSAIATNSLGSIIAIVCILIFSGLRISDEEKLMHEKFGKKYADYSKKVKAFIPGIV